MISQNSKLLLRKHWIAKTLLNSRENLEVAEELCIYVVLPKMGSPNNIERLSDLFKQPQMTSEVTEVNYLEVTEELC